MHCTTCGKELIEGYKFCTACGTPAYVPANMAPAAPAAPAAPMAPVMPAAPEAPMAPVMPAAPEAPMAPAMPAAPEAPMAMAPAMPAAPEAPMAPAAPVMPAAPEAPVAPEMPAAPEVPAAPEKIDKNAAKAAKKAEEEAAKVAKAAEKAAKKAAKNSPAQTDISNVAVSADSAQEASLDNTPISMWGYFGYTILYIIPVIGLICILINAFKKSGNINARNYARGHICLRLLAYILIAATLAVLFILFPA